MTERIRVVIDPDLVELIPGFLNNRRRDVDVLREAVAKADYNTARIIGHSMKGAGGGYGFQPITEFGDAIEVAALAADGAQILAAATLLEDYLARVDPVIE